MLVPDTSAMLALNEYRRTALFSGCSSSTTGLSVRKFLVYVTLPVMSELNKHLSTRCDDCDGLPSDPSYNNRDCDTAFHKEVGRVRKLTHALLQCITAASAGIYPVCYVQDQGGEDVLLSLFPEARKLKADQKILLVTWC